MSRKRKKVMKPAEDARPSVYVEEAPVVIRPLAMSLTVNGGKNELDSATVPIQWFFSPEAAEKRPTHIVVCEQNGSEMNYNYSDSGRRYFREVENGIAFIQLFSPGKHRIAVLAFAGQNAGKEVETYLEKTKHGYRRNLCWDSMKDRRTPPILSELSNIACVGVATAEFTVPASEFSSVPTSKLGQAAWWWVNKFHRAAPRDECEYRKRLWFYTVPKIPVLIGYLIGKTFAGVLSSVCFLTVAATFAFVGLRPKTIKALIKSAWAKNWGEITEASDILRFDQYLYPSYQPRYRLWKAEKVTEDGEWKFTYLWFAPWEVCVMALPFVLLGVAWWKYEHIRWFAFFLAISIIGMIAVCIALWTISRFIDEKMKGTWVERKLSATFDKWSGLSRYCEKTWDGFQEH
ncbi:MAG: hypothetical protein NTY66_02950, partial [Candidatus Vogelbacteria bacterium]|nr:hypothetical protein [Candidatus Vogelbacteria bacterium]